MVDELYVSLYSVGGAVREAGVSAQCDQPTAQSDCASHSHPVCSPQPRSVTVGKSKGPRELHSFCFCLFYPSYHWVDF